MTDQRRAGHLNDLCRIREHHEFKILAAVLNAHLDARKKPMTPERLLALWIELDAVANDCHRVNDQITALTGFINRSSPVSSNRVRPSGLGRSEGSS